MLPSARHISPAGRKVTKERQSTTNYHRNLMFDLLNFDCFWLIHAITNNEHDFVNNTSLAFNYGNYA